MFRIDTCEKNEAVNYATLISLLKISEHRLEPMFSEIGNHLELSIPIDNPCVSQDYAKFFNVDVNTLISAYNFTKKAFMCLHENDEIIKRGNIDYPKLLSETEQAPRFLYLRGNKSLLSENRTVALVGSRHASDQSKRNTEKLAVKLGENGIVIISGLAKGIDVSAHEAALNNGFNTIAVIGTSLNQYYPPENKEVQNRIEEMGLVVSQFSPVTQTQRWNFPLRNGVMSGLSLATIIMEAGETSGALIQADYALKQKRKVLIPKSALMNTRITWPAKYVKKGAEVFESSVDVLRLLVENEIFKPGIFEERQQTIDDLLAASYKDTKSSNLPRINRISFLGN